MTREKLGQLIATIQEFGSELPDVDAKAARGGTPKRLYESLSAFSNHLGGGVILLGLDENRRFEVVGVGDPHRIQEDTSSLASAEMEPALRPAFTIEQIAGKTVVAIEVEELSLGKKPCYYKPAGLQGGAYIRVGNTNRRMTSYEIFGYVSSHEQPRFDEGPVLSADLEDLDRPKLERYIRALRVARPGAAYLKESFKDVLLRLRVVCRHDTILKPTLAGLLMFGKRPQEYEPQLVITFLHYYGTTEAEPTPKGERFLDNREFDGTIPEMVESSVNHVLTSMRKSSLVEGLWRRDIPEYPVEALREAVVNAVAHRDYSDYVRGSYIQIRLFADRLEIQSPGGLHGNVTEENLEEEQSTRNRMLMRFMEDSRLVENRGSGIRAMIEATRRANLEPPKFHDKRSSFWVTFHNHTLMGPAEVEWLNQFADRSLTDSQRLALVYLRSNERMTNGDYRRLNHVETVAANRELRRLVQSGLVSQHGTKRGAYYTLSPLIRVMRAVRLTEEEEKIMAFVRENSSIGNVECRNLLGVKLHRAWYLLRKLSNRGLLKKEGDRRTARYVMP